MISKSVLLDTFSTIQKCFKIKPRQSGWSLHQYFKGRWIQGKINKEAKSKTKRLKKTPRMKTHLGKRVDLVKLCWKTCKNSRKKKMIKTIKWNK